MCTASQVAAEYESLVQLWDRIVMPELAASSRHTPPGWRGYGFVYLFDRFCHFIVVEVGRKNWNASFPTLGKGDKAKRQKQFAEFLRQYLKIVAKTPEQFRQQQHQFSQRLSTRDSPATQKSRCFFSTCMRSAPAPMRGSGKKLWRRLTQRSGDLCCS